MTGTIYCLENTATDKLYIGKTTRPLHERLAEHKAGRGRARALNAAILKYGWENFALKVIEEIPAEDLDEAEKFWIAFCQTKAPNGYNLTDGGEGLQNPSAETKELIRDAQMRLVEEGTHHWVGNNNPNNICHQMIAEGTHNFLTNHPMHSPEILARKCRTERRNRGTIDWVDQQEFPDE